MNRMNLHVDQVQDFVMTNVLLVIDNKKSKEVSFSNQLLSQATTNPRNQGASSSQMHNLNHIHVDKEAVKMTLAISSFRRWKYLPNPYNDHHFHQGTIDEEVPIVVPEQDSDS